MAHYTNETLFNIVWKGISKDLKKIPNCTKVTLTLCTDNLYQEGNKFDEKYLTERLKWIGLKNISIQKVEEYRFNLLADIGQFKEFTNAKHFVEFKENEIRDFKDLSDLEIENMYAFAK